MRTWVNLSPPKDFDPRLIKLFKQINLNGQQQSTAMYRVGQGLSPDNAGNALFDGTPYFKLAGRAGGQFGYGDIAASGALTLSSTSATTKGKIYLGSAQTQAAYDENLGYLGVGTVAPAAPLHLLSPVSLLTYRPITSVGTMGDGSAARGWLTSAGLYTTPTHAPADLLPFFNDNAATTWVGDQAVGIAGFNYLVFTFGATIPPPTYAGHTLHIKWRNPIGGGSSYSVNVQFKKSGVLVSPPGIISFSGTGTSDTWQEWTYTLSTADATSWFAAGATNAAVWIDAIYLAGTGGTPLAVQFADMWLTIPSSSSTPTFRVDTIGTTTAATIIDLVGNMGVRTGDIPLTSSLQVSAPSASTVASVFKALTGQTGDLLQCQSSAGAATGGFKSTGALYLLPGTGGNAVMVDSGGAGTASWTPRGLLSFNNDTNIQMTVQSGTPSIALIGAVNFNLIWNGTLSKLRGGSGIADASVSSNLTAQTTNIAAQTILTGTAGTAGMYRVSVYIKTTTAGTALDVVKATVAWNDGAAQTLDVPFENATVIFNNHDLATLNAFSQGSIVVNSAASQNITYTTTVTKTGTPQYEIHVRIEALG